MRLRDVQATLEGSVWPGIRRLRAHVDDGVVTLTGYVGRYWEKHMACRLVRQIPGVRDVVDRTELYSL